MYVCVYELSCVPGDVARKCRGLLCRVRRHHECIDIQVATEMFDERVLSESRAKTLPNQTAARPLYVCMGTCVVIKSTYVFISLSYRKFIDSRIRARTGTPPGAATTTAQ